MLGLFLLSNYRYIDKINKLISKIFDLTSFSMSESSVNFFTNIILLSMLFIICILAFYLSKLIIKNIIFKIISKTKNEWDDKLFSNNFFNRVAYLVPATLIIKLLPFVIPGHDLIISIIMSATNIYVVVVVMLAIFSLINSFSDIYSDWDIAKYKPIKGYLQLIKVLLFIIVLILVVSIIFGKSPFYLLTGLGALSAVLLLVFKDALLGLVAGIQLSANDMARPGDWISMPKYNADGDIEEITLTTVKVRNFDRTLVYIPAYALISDSFVNWRGMYEADGRRIKRALNIDMNSVVFCNEEMIENFKKIELIKNYISNKQNEIKSHNSNFDVDENLLVNGRRQTNIGVFRAYIEAYLRSLSSINQDSILMVRQLASSEKGVPLEVYAFSKNKEWVVYENVQSDIFDHLIASLSVFGLKLYQSPSGGDVKDFIREAKSIK